MGAKIANIFLIAAGAAVMLPVALVFLPPIIIIVAGIVILAYARIFRDWLRKAKISAVLRGRYARS